MSVSPLYINYQKKFFDSSTIHQITGVYIRIFQPVSYLSILYVNQASYYFQETCAYSFGNCYGFQRDGRGRKRERYGISSVGVDHEKHGITIVLSPLYDRADNRCWDTGFVLIGWRVHAEDLLDLEGRNA